ncbi:MAG: hypothetical protein LYZ66_02725 [Nitrososphaerales archaeon]|nr:hypothetical protein [Nitrososphaerales archaeon]
MAPNPKQQESRPKSGEVVRYNPEKRRLEDPLTNLRVMAIDQDFYKGLRDRLFESFQSGATVILYEMGLGYGRLMGKRILQMGQSKLRIYRRFMNRGKYTGLGEFDTPLLKTIISGLKGEPVVRLKNSFYAASVGRTGQEECFIMAGTIAGSASVILSKELDCKETMCISRGDAYCEFQLKEKSR